MYLITCLGEQKYPVISLNPIYLVHEVQIFRRLSRSNGCIDFDARVGVKVLRIDPFESLISI